jgi:hypothetical protein
MTDLPVIEKASDEVVCGWLTLNDRPSSEL